MIILQFRRLDSDTEDVKQKYHVPIDRCWQDGPDDQHIQFEPGGDNFCIPYGKYEVEMYPAIRHGLILNFSGIEFQAEPAEGSIQLDQKELEGFWPSPNR